MWMVGAALFTLHFAFVTLHFALCNLDIAILLSSGVSSLLRACLFDIDGTLVSTGGAGKAAMDAALLDEFGIRKPIVPGSMSGRTDRGIASDQFELHRIDDTPENWRRLIEAYVRHLPRYLHERPGTVLPGIFDVLALLAG